MAPKPTSPLLGYNNNVRHKGKLFHVQTEDSGVKYGHIVTQLFVDGGRILKSVKTSYAEHIGSDRRGEIVREMMKQQHKAMFIALRDGHFDGLIDGTASEAPAPSARPTQSTLPESPRISAVLPAAAVALKEVPYAPAAPTMKMASVPQPSSPQVPRQPQPRARTDSAVRGTKTVLPAGSRYSVMPSAPTLSSAGERRTSLPTEHALRSTLAAGRARPGRYRSASVDDLANDKSLDEVILSYLAAELENNK